MDSDFTLAILLFVILTGTCTGVFFKTVDTRTCPVSLGCFKQFSSNFVRVYGLIAAALWLQAPAMYPKFANYGQRRLMTEQLVATFGSSMIFGPMLGAMADRYGRKLLTKVYCVTTIIACILQQYPNYGCLMASRVVTGMSSSLLYSCVEAWVVHEHLHRGYEPILLGGLFASAIFTANGLMGIIAGVVLDILWDALEVAPAVPFQVAAMLAVVLFIYVRLTWSENYGAKLSSDRATVFSDLSTATWQIFSDRRLLLLGATQVLFEGAMHIFTFHWVGMLSFNGRHVPYREVFICFMGALMAGSTLGGKLVLGGREPEAYLVWVILAAALSVLLALLTHLFLEDLTTFASDVDSGEQLQAAAFVLFQFFSGVFLPSMMKLRSHYLAEDNRATVLSILRVPLNFLVCLVTFRALDVTVWGMFTVCTAMLLGAAVFQRMLFVTTLQEDHRQHFMQC